MKTQPAITEKPIRGALHIAALAALVAPNIGGLWLCVLYFGAFALTSLLHEALGRGGGRARSEWAYIAMKAGLAAGSLFWFRGLGPAFLLCILVLDTSLAFRPIASGILSAAALAVLLAAQQPGLEAAILESALFVSIYLLANALKGEKELGKSMEETISALRINEKRLADANRRMQEYGGELEEAARIRERGRILKGIHDTLGHALTAITVQLSAALEVAGGEAPAAMEHVRSAREQARGGLASVRQTIHTLDDSGETFAERLKQAAEAAEKDMQIRILPIIESDIELTAEGRQILLSCLKEGLTNGVRHGGATAFVLKVEAAGDAVHLYLEDNGHGCASFAKGYGLTAMAEAVEQCGGTFEASGMPEGGFYLNITLPAARNGE